MSEKDITLIKIKRIHKLINLWNSIEKKITNKNIKTELQIECIFLIKKNFRNISL